MSVDFLSGILGSGSLSLLLLLAKATIILIAAFGATLAMQRASAGARHLVWLIAIGAVLFLPALASWSPLRLEILPPELADRTAAAANAAGRAPEASAASPLAGNEVATVRQTLPAGSVPAVQSPTGAASKRLMDKALTGAMGLVVVWATVAALFAAWLIYGALSVRRIVRRASALDTPDWLNPLWEISDRFGLDEPPRLLRSTDAKMPFAAGLAQPTIVLPAECEQWTLDRRRAVLLHELAHVRRRDLLGHTLGRFACAVYWFHPLVWTASKRLRAESERACDDLALTCGARPSDYAEHLLDIVTCVGRHTTPAVAMAMARRKEFEGRLLAILDPELRRAAPSRRESLSLAGALVVLSVVVGAAAPARAADGSTSSMDAARDARQPASGMMLSDRAASETLRTENNARMVSEKRTVTRTSTENSSRMAEASAAPRAARESEQDAADAQVTTGPVGSNSLTIEQLTAAAQGRGDERPKLLANVLRTDTSVALRRVAAWGLANYADVDVAAEALANAVARDADASVREMAAWALGHGGHGESAVIEALGAALRRDANVKVRATAAWALGNLGDREAVPQLTEALGDTSLGVRMRAAWALGNVHPREAPAALVTMLGDREPNARRVAAWALFNIRDPKAVDALDAALRRETEKEVQHAFIRALAATGEESVEAIKRLIDSKDAEVRSMAIRALAGGNATGPWPWPWPEPRPHAR